MGGGGGDRLWAEAPRLAGLEEDVDVGGGEDALAAADPALVPVAVDAADQGDGLA